MNKALNGQKAYEKMPKYLYNYLYNYLNIYNNYKLNHNVILLHTYPDDNKRRRQISIDNIMETLHKSSHFKIMSTCYLSQQEPKNKTSNAFSEGNTEPCKRMHKEICTGIILILVILSLILRIKNNF